ncbi:hypothetical protein HW556_17210 [Hymenobacter sp. P5252]|uniref:Uncharacterized protein n=1 Tax=Hymenobacter terrestris TaxID=2748310 RepID=A0ABX2Q9H6_9BACT|nr:hypothetical protein [Hymenobacter terrestris]
MLRHGLPTRDEREILGRLVRIIGGFPLSRFGRHLHRADLFGRQPQAGTYSYAPPRSVLDRRLGNRFHRPAGTISAQ